MDDLRPQELIDDYRTPKVPDDTCCGLGETTLAKARTQPATGFVYMVNRFYEPETGRFTQADKLAFDPTQLANAQNNRWTYCGNDPVNLSDPTGRFAQFFFLLGLLAGFGVGAAIAYEMVTTGTTSVLTAILGALSSIVFTLLLDSVAVGCKYNYESYFFAQLRALLAMLAAAGFSSLVGLILAAGWAFLLGFIAGIGIGLGIGMFFGSLYVIFAMNEPALDESEQLCSRGFGRQHLHPLMGERGHRDVPRFFATV